MCSMNIGYSITQFKNETATMFLSFKNIFLVTEPDDVHLSCNTFIQCLMGVSCDTSSLSCSHERPEAVERLDWNKLIGQYYSVCMVFF